SCDHRIVDGAVAAAFIQHIKRLIETPALLFL
ncbi:MAG TPA: 2-oxo acid dehydrogenase subunit E2, partial [Acidobacteriota bacterium]|nr:2-oxo acid dehydrogenase subunit E2 [Acidobacteriota bacterium]